MATVVDDLVEVGMTAVQGRRREICVEDQFMVALLRIPDECCNAHGPPVKRSVKRRPQLSTCKVRGQCDERNGQDQLRRKN